MVRSASDSPATALLMKCVGEGAIGCVVIGAGTNKVLACVMRGQIVACERSDDAQRVLHHLATHQTLSAHRLEILRSCIDQGRPLLPLLVKNPEVPHEVLEDILFSVFLENLTAFVGSVDIPVFRTLPTVFTDNLQVGYDANALVEQCCADWDQANGMHINAPWIDAPTLTDNEVTIFEDDEPTLASDAPFDTTEEWDDDQETEVFRIGEELSQYMDDDDDPDTETQIIRIRKPIDSTVLRQDDLAAFGDFDRDRSAFARSEYKKTHHKDRVEVSPTHSTPTSHDQYQTPGLSDSQVLSKISVASDVLHEVGRVFDNSLGPNAGTVLLQRILDRSPRRFATLFHSVVLPSTCRLPAERLSTNLKTLPPKEQRLYLNQALIDLIERSLSIARQELPPHALDKLRNEVIGYRHRLGR
ncbi:MAG: hypothetical protein HN348_06505 [Proteobacteria bacterium]|nr:hypothetical protein [Pseudomonadota bacterium]